MALDQTMDTRVRSQLVLCKCLKHLHGEVPTYKLKVVIDPSRLPLNAVWLNLAAPTLLVADEMWCLSLERHLNPSQAARFALP